MGVGCVRARSHCVITVLRSQWRSWNCMQGNVDEVKIRDQLQALAAKRPVANGRSRGALASLVDLGYVHAGVDDGWQLCDSFRVLPSNSSAFHDAGGIPIVNGSKFGDLAALAAHARSLNASLGWYQNNCICHESGGHIRNKTWRALTYAGDVGQLAQSGFGGVKLDNCGLHNDLDLMQTLRHRAGLSGKVLVEAAHQGKDTPTNRSWCPMHLFRSSGDIRSNFASTMRNLHSMHRYENISRPGTVRALRCLCHLRWLVLIFVHSAAGCWAYADMVMHLRPLPAPTASTRPVFL
jgi:hypothetical protein